jgi:hypothetical protein
MSQGASPAGRHGSATNPPRPPCPRSVRCVFPPYCLGARPIPGPSSAPYGFMALLHGPPALIRTHHLSRRPFVQSGHQDFRLFEPQVTPSCTQHHRDVTAVPQTQACAIHPAGFAARASWQAGYSDALLICARQMRYHVFESFLLDRLPRPRQSAHQAPLPGRIVGVALQDHLYIGLRAIGGRAFDEDSLGLRGRDKASAPLTQ